MKYIIALLTVLVAASASAQWMPSDSPQPKDDVGTTPPAPANTYGEKRDYAPVPNNPQYEYVPAPTPNNVNNNDRNYGRASKQ